MTQLLQALSLPIHLDALLAMLRYGRGVELRWRNLPGAPVIALLTKYGVKTYAPRMISDRERSIRVPAQQGRWAEYLCKRAGIPMSGALIDASNRNVKPGPMPQEWKVPARPVGFVGMIFRIFSTR